MEYVPGIPITDYCDRNLLGFRERLALFQQVCHAVQHAHQKGIIHRDLKPSNVLVTLLDGKPVPKVIDFGVAKAVNQRLTEKTLFTETGMLIGTPEYMSPEQADLTGLDVDTTTDIYSLGVLLYELLVGALPFDIKELRRAGYAAIQRVIREQEPPRPSTRLSGLGQTASEIARCRRSDVRTLIRLLRGDLEWITMKALEKDRTRRYATASEFAADIGRHLASEPVSAGPPSFAYRFQKAVRRNRGKVAAAAAVAAALVFGLISSVLLYVRADRQRTVAEWEGYKASLAAALSDVEIGRSEDARARLRSVPKYLRGWEWNHLYWRSDRSLATLYTADNGMAQVGFSADSSHLYVSGRVTVHAWETAGFRRSAVYGPFNPIVTMSRDGSKLACWADDNQHKTIQIVETFTGNSIAILEGHRGPIVTAVFNGDGTRLATRSQDDEMRVWATGTGQTLVTIHAPTPQGGGFGNPPATVFAFSRDGRRLASIFGSRIALWDAVTGRGLANWESEQENIQSLAFSPDGTRLYSLVSGVRVWDGSSGKFITALTQSSSGGYLLAAESPDGSQIADMTWHKELHLWDRKSGTLVATLNGLWARLSSLAYSPDGKYLVAANVHGEARVWEGRTDGGLFLRIAKTTFGAQDLSKSGERLAVADGAEVQLLDAGNGEILRSWTEGRPVPVVSVAYNPKGDEIASASEDGAICVWTERSSSPRLRIHAHNAPVSALAYSPDGRQLASAAGLALAPAPHPDTTLRVWDVETGRIRFTRELDAPTRWLGFSPDGKVLLVSCHSGVKIRRLDAASGADLAPLEDVSMLTRTTWSPAFNRTGTRIVAGPIWDAATGKKLLQLGETAVETPVYSFTPDGSRVVGAFNDTTISIWHSGNGDRLLRLYFQGASQIHFSPDGARMYGNEYGAIRIYESRPAIPPEADELYEQLSSRFPLVCERRAFLVRGADIDPKLRDIVLRMIEGKGEDIETVFRLVDSVLYSPKAEPAAYAQALRRAQMMAEDRPWGVGDAGRLGIARYRGGEYAGALASIERAVKMYGGTTSVWRAFTAMAQARLGRQEEARKTMAAADQFRLMPGAGNAAAYKAVLEEAERLIGVPPAK